MNKEVNKGCEFNITVTLSNNPHKIYRYVTYYSHRIKLSVKTKIKH